MTFSDTSTLRSGSAHDVIVVGARAAGAATAMLLARHGMRTLVLDQGAHGADTLSTHALLRGAVLQLARWGLLDEILAAGTPLVRRTTFHYGNRSVVVPIKPANGVDGLVAPRRTLLDPLLVRAAVEAGADVHHRTAVTGLLRHRGRVTGVRAATAEGRTVELRAPLVIGADGIRSLVAREVGAKDVRVGHALTATTYGYWTNLPADGFEWVFRPQACSGIIPTNDGRTCVFAGAAPERIGRGGVGLILDLVAEGTPEVAERLRRATPPSGTRTWGGHRGYLRQAHGPGWALVGDAGYFKDPISAHGLTDALRDAELLARAVIGGAGGEATLDASLGHYQATRDRLSGDLFDVVDRVASQQWDDEEIAVLLLELSASMADEVAMLGSLDAELAR